MAVSLAIFEIYSYSGRPTGSLSYGLPQPNGAIFNYLNPDFKVTPLLNAECLRNGRRYRHSYNEIGLLVKHALHNATSSDLDRVT